MNERDYIIRKRAEAKRERYATRRLNPDATQAYAIFADWLICAHGVEDWRTLSEYQLWDYYCEYQLECAKAGVEWQNPKIFGIDNAIF